MKNLLERLKPEYLQLLNEDAKLYPFMTESIKNILLKCVTFIQLDIYTANQLCVICKINFGMLEINNLFEANE